MAASDAPTVRITSWNRWSLSLLGLVGGGFHSVDDEVGGSRERMLLESVDFSLSSGRESGARDNVTDFALTLAGYSMEGEKGVKLDCRRRLKLNRTRVSECRVQCCICLEDFELGEDAEQTPCKHQFHGCCIGPWLQKGNGTSPMWMFQIPGSREGSTERFAFAYGREQNRLRYGGRRLRSRIQGIRNYARRWAPM